MWVIWTKELLAKALKSSPKCKISPNLVTLDMMCLWGGVSLCEQEKERERERERKGAKKFKKKFTTSKVLEISKGRGGLARFYNHLLSIS